jgi:hypothetical protein
VPHLDSPELEAELCGKHAGERVVSGHRHEQWKRHCSLILTMCLQVSAHPGLIMVPLTLVIILAAALSRLPGSR